MAKHRAPRPSLASRLRRVRDELAELSMAAPLTFAIVAIGALMARGT